MSTTINPRLAHPPPPGSTFLHRTTSFSIFSTPSGPPIVINHILPNPRTITIGGLVYNAAALRRHRHAIALLSRCGPDLPVPFSCSEAIAPWWFFPLLQEEVEREKAVDAAVTRALMMRRVSRSQQQEDEEEEEEVAEPPGSNFIYVGDGFYGGDEKDGGDSQSQDGAEVAAPASAK
ncbi:hypothetical protein CSOJ01_11328 [Colletotrichum sojae]|uniref:Uncharacterized protein n=1 Tax=Colletotrichum sojae TaxID=2175907 RepID=A0A8H6IYP5_9PEZI|nr:hypothetical protein CSOJ01_11328 [Colletotrichum sojae]